ncbi:D-threo-aldose 1-dehydrogenase [Agreia bicolorata]|uniref:Aldo/keto reductase n=1 Tax=Agreia bicolorata TaxID=110935 RepID=A0A1T4WWD9_9MICO|nr:aldo/keto reductase [Agreia bicolorata]KJC63631.1 aldo/keto reductase [Agreia bicolorata]SKA81680.1 D-threo-aldose 1-dehydrogenase [Agreia bicolorata]
MKHDAPSRLGRTDISVTALGFGATAIGGMYSPVPEEQAIATVDAAWNHGIRFYDAAPQYGRGKGELRLGQALASRPRDSYVLSSKVGRLLRPVDPEGNSNSLDEPELATVYDYSRDGVLRSIEESLERLGTDHLDIVHVHDPDDYLDEALATAFPTLIELRDQGVVKAIGAGMNQTRALEIIARESDPDALLVAGRYTLLEQTALDSLLPLCEERGIAVIAGGVFNSGLLANPHVDARYDYNRAPESIVSRALELAAVCERHGVPLKAAALQFPKAHPSVAAVLTGSRSPEEMTENIELFDLVIPSDLWAELKDAGLLRQTAPVPATGQANP